MSEALAGQSPPTGGATTSQAPGGFFPVVSEVSVDEIWRNPDNPRTFRDHDARVTELAQSIREKGVLQPILIRPTPNWPEGAIGHYTIIAGERRWRASKEAGLATIPAIIRTDLTDQEALELTVTENLQREDLEPLEEANGVASLIAAGASHEAVADRLGKPLSWVARRARLTNLSPAWRKLVATNEGVARWSAVQLELIARLEQPVQDRWLDQHQGFKYNAGGWDERQLRESLADFTRVLRLAPWKLTDETLLPEAGSCVACPKRSGCHPGLFDDEVDHKGKKLSPEDRCLDAACWNAKLDRHLEAKADWIRAEHGRVVFVGHNYGMKAPAFVKEIVSPYTGTRAKKGAPGAVPVLHVSGEEKGRFDWMTFETPRAQRAVAAAADGGKPKVTPLAERRKALEARRRAFTLREICDAVEKSSTPPIPTLLTLVAGYGTGHGRDNESGYAPESFAAPEKVKDPAAKVWEDTAQVISRFWMKAHRIFGLAGIEKVWPQILTVAPLVGVDIGPFVVKAENAIPEPKSWAALAAAEAAKKKTVRKPTPKAKAKPVKKAKRK